MASASLLGSARQYISFLLSENDKFKCDYFHIHLEGNEVHITHIASTIKHKIVAPDFITQLLHTFLVVRMEKDGNDTQQPAAILRVEYAFPQL